jgi:hypothetical protein
MAWRDHLKVHPACNLLPAMSPDELRALGEDIKQRRMQERVKLLKDGDGRTLIDGRSRLDAHEVVGLPTQIFGDDGKPNIRFFEVVDLNSLGISAEAYVISMNLHRRHLSAEKKGELLDQLIKADPTRSDREIGRDAHVDHKTVGAHRENLEKRGEIPHLEKRNNSQGQEYSATKHKIRRGATSVAAELRLLGDDILPHLGDNTIFALALKKTDPLAKHNLALLTTSWRKLPFEKQERVAEIASNRGYERAWRALERALDKNTMGAAKASAKAKTQSAPAPAKDEPPPQASPPTQPTSEAPQPAASTSVQQHLPLPPPPPPPDIERLARSVRLQAQISPSSVHMGDVIVLCDWIVRYADRIKSAA